MINITVSNTFKNNNLLELLSKNDLHINETILNYGVILYNNQYNILKNYIIDTDSQKYNDIVSNKQIEIDLLLNEINNNDKKYKDIFLKKENDFQNELCQNKDYYENKIKNFQNDIDKLKNDKFIEVSSLIDKGKQITKDEYEKIIYLHQNLNNELKNTYDIQIKNYIDKNSKLQNIIQDLNNKLINFNNINQNNNYDTINSNFNILNDKVSNYFDKMFKSSNTEKGIIGENFIEQYLIDKFSNCKIINTSKETAKGDMLFSFDKINTLIESKNVQTLKKDDIDKFYRDIELRTSKNEINSALLISLNDTNLINGKRHFYFEIKFNIPIIMISNAFNNIDFIRFSILVINYLVKNGFTNINQINQSNDNKFIFIINSLNDIFNTFKLQLNYLHNDKHLLLKMEDSFRKRENDLYNIEKMFNIIFSKFPEFYSNTTTNSNSNSNTNDIVDDSLNNIILTIKNKLNHDPNFIINIRNLEEELKISNTSIRKNGGIKKIIQSFNNNILL